MDDARELHVPGLTLNETIAAPRPRVWDVFTDLELFEREVEAITSIERIDGTGFHVGTKWRETRVMYGRVTTEEMWVTAAEEPERYVVEARSQGAHYRTEYRFTPEDDGTRVDIDFSAEATSAITKLLTPLTFKATKKGIGEAMTRDLRTLKAVAERDT